MKIYKLHAGDKERIAIRTTKDKVLSPRNKYTKATPHTISDIDILTSNVDRNLTALSQGHYTINIPSSDLFHKVGREYKKGTIVKHLGQTFMAKPHDGYKTRVTPNPYSKDWIAITSDYGFKCIGYDMPSSQVSISINENEFGSLLSRLPYILDSGRYYEVFKDGDYFKLMTPDSSTMYTMRINYREWVNPDNNETYISVDAISDEVIPTISFNVQDSFENNRTSNKVDINFMSIKNVLSAISDRLESYLTTTFVGNYEINKRHGDIIGIKYGNYVGYGRGKVGTAPIIKIPNFASGGVDDTTNRPLYEMGKIWLPNEKEVFGKNIKSSAYKSECAFRQYPSLDTPFKRIKTLNGTPVPWATYSLFKDKAQPVAVNVDGSMVTEERYFPSSGFNKVYVPLCITLCTYLKKK